MDLWPEVVESPTEGVPPHLAQPRRGTFMRREHAAVHQLLRQGCGGACARLQVALRARSRPSRAQTAAEDKANPQSNE
jgi:hypothetical protein